MFFGAFLFREANIEKETNEERWEKMDCKMFKEQLAALLKERAGDDFEVKTEMVPKLNGIEKEAFVIGRKQDWIGPTIYVELLYKCYLQGMSISKIADKMLEQYRNQGDLLQGVTLPDGGTLRIEKNYKAVELSEDMPEDKADNRILKVCKGLSQDLGKKHGIPCNEVD